MKVSINIGLISYTIYAMVLKTANAVPYERYEAARAGAPDTLQVKYGLDIDNVIPVNLADTGCKVNGEEPREEPRGEPRKEPIGEPRGEPREDEKSEKIVKTNRRNSRKSKNSKEGDIFPGDNITNNDSVEDINEVQEPNNLFYEEINRNDGFDINGNNVQSNFVPATEQTIQQIENLNEPTDKDIEQVLQGGNCDLNNNNEIAQVSNQNAGNTTIPQNQVVVPGNQVVPPNPVLVPGNQIVAQTPVVVPQNQVVVPEAPIAVPQNQVVPQTSIIVPQEQVAPQNQIKLPPGYALFRKIQAINPANGNKLDEINRRQLLKNQNRYIFSVPPSVNAVTVATPPVNAITVAAPPVNAVTVATPTAMPEVKPARTHFVVIANNPQNVVGQPPLQQVIEPPTVNENNSNGDEALVDNLGENMIYDINEQMRNDISSMKSAVSSLQQKVEAFSARPHKVFVNKSGGAGKPAIPAGAVRVGPSPAPAPPPAGAPPTGAAPPTAGAPPAGPAPPPAGAPPPVAGAPPAGAEGGDSQTYTGDGTYYDPGIGLGSCGTLNMQTEMVGAMNHLQYGNEPNPNNAAICKKCVMVSYTPVGGVTKTQKIRITDKCPVCKYGDIDLSTEAFRKLAPLEVGRIKISWQFVPC
ncbi:hypothetical protein BB558_005479 [Smittium angustum]|uniref:Expansin-like EG45 domain-containing protein n=1 Tax=Smittium angustum TaxID=133377 RepID=A0A2U1J0D7_SMIAN|nr:hypothetical protein BB558_005479 [Smittium angustum]